MANASKQKKMKVRQKDYIGLVNPPQASHLWGSSGNALRQTDKSDGKQSQVKVRLEDYLTIVEMSDGIQETSTNKSLLKSTKQRREIFTDGFQSSSKDKRKQTIFSKDDMIHKRKEKGALGEPGALVVRRHSPREMSKTLENVHSSPKHHRKHGRRCLKEESPTDFGAYLHEKLSNWIPHIGASVKEKMPTVSGNSKSYDLLKGQEKLDRSTEGSSESKKSTSIETSDKEIYISLDKKTPREKDDCINQSKTKIFGEYEQLTDVFGDVSDAKDVIDLQVAGRKNEE